MDIRDYIKGRLQELASKHQRLKEEIVRIEAAYGELEQLVKSINGENGGKNCMERTDR